MNIFYSQAWYHPTFTNFIVGVEVTMTLSDNGILEAVRVDTGEILFSVNKADIKHVYDKNRYSLGLVLNNGNRYMFSFTKRLDATKSILLAPLYYNWIAPLFNNPLIQERRKLVALLKNQGIAIYRDKRLRSIGIGILIALLFMVAFVWWLFSE